jgi:uncharacterized protein Usg
MWNIILVVLLLCTQNISTAKLYAKDNLMLQTYTWQSDVAPNPNVTIVFNFVTRDISRVFSQVSFQYLAISNSSTFNAMTLLVQQDTDEIWRCLYDSLDMCDVTGYSNYRLLGLAVTDTAFFFPAKFLNLSKGDLYIRGGMKRGIYPANVVQNYYVNNLQSFSLNQSIANIFATKFEYWSMFGSVKAEYLHVAPFLLTMLLYLCSATLCIILSSQQPLKSRGLVPIAMNAFLLLDLFSGMIGAWVLSLDTLVL